MRVHSNIGISVSRILPQIFNDGDSACGTDDPNTLNGGHPSLKDAMGLSGIEGMMSFMHDSDAPREFTVWVWSELMLRVSGGTKGWVKLGAVESAHTSTVDPYCIAAITVPEKLAVFIQADENIDNFLMGGCIKHGANPNHDRQPG